MKFQELLVLLPCHSLEDFPQHHTGNDADGLLANWTALWHPALIAAAGRAPTWARVDSPPADLKDRLLLVPAVSNDQLPTGFTQRAQTEGACLLRKMTDRREILTRAFELLDGVPAQIEADLAGDFLALGYCYLQVQLLTRQMRYASNLDEVHFHAQLVAGATAAAQGDAGLAREKLTSCFDLLAEERDHYYSVDAYLLDLTLVAEQTMGAALAQELAGGQASNLLLSAHVGELLAQTQPATRDVLVAGLRNGTAGVIGGEWTEQRLPLLSCESVLRDLQRGLAGWRSLCDHHVEIFGRRRAGLTPLLPQVLHRLGFKGALHLTLDDGRFPLGTQGKTRWEGADGATVDALARPPLDASKADTFLGLARKLGESMDSDHVATLVFAHWPGHASVWYDDLRRCARYGAALGKFVTAAAYFRDTYMPGHLDRFQADQYRAPYLKQAVIRSEADPLSTVQRYWQRHVTADCQATLTALTALVQGRPASPSASEFWQRLDDSSEQADAAGLDEPLAVDLQGAVAAFAACVPRASDAPGPGYLLLNPFTFVRRMGIELPQLTSSPKVEAPIYAAAETASTKYVVVDVPPMGFAWVAGEAPARRKSRSEPVMAEDLRARENMVVLRNEFFEALINVTTGALSSVKDYKKRTNRVSQQLALRSSGPRRQAGEEWRDPDETAVYSVMAADNVEIAVATASYGEVRVRGRLLDQEGQELARFRETFSLWRGSRVLQLDVELETLREPGSDPWNTYYAARFAWSDEAADLYRGVNQIREAAKSKYLEAPLYLDIDAAEMHTTILTSGLPFHRRVGDRMLDTLLVTRGERARRFRLGIGVDVPFPHNEALAFLAPPTAHFHTAAPPKSGASSWLFHIDARHVVATHWEPLVEADQVVGFRVRLLETAGRATRARVSAFRPIRAARYTDFRGESRGECQLDEGRLQVELASGEWQQVEARW